MLVLSIYESYLGAKSGADCPQAVDMDVLIISKSEGSSNGIQYLGLIHREAFTCV